ncbi:hypothetical protein D9M68_471660 [compost metagenome]
MQVLHHPACEGTEDRVGHRPGHGPYAAQLRGIGDRRMRAVQHPQLHGLERPDIARHQRAVRLPRGPRPGEAVFDHPLRERLADNGSLIA